MDKVTLNNSASLNASSHRTIRYWFHTASLVLSAITVLGSTAVIFLISTSLRLRNKANMFVLSLMVADLLIGLFIPPLEAVCAFSFQKWCNNKFLLKVFFNFLLSASITNLVGMTIERFIYLVLPLRYPTHMTSRRTALAITLS